jgi:hypothetical protein
MNTNDAVLSLHMSESHAAEALVCFVCQKQFSEYEDALFGDTTVLTEQGEFPVCQACEEAQQ